MGYLHFGTTPLSSAMKPVSASSIYLWVVYILVPLHCQFVSACNFVLVRCDIYLWFVYIFGTTPLSSEMKPVSASSFVLDKCNIYLQFVYILVPLHCQFVSASSFVLDRCNIYLWFVYILVPLHCHLQ